MTSPSPSLRELGHSVGPTPDAHPPKGNDHDHNNDSDAVQARRVSSESSHECAPGASESPTSQAEIISEPTEDKIPAHQELVTTQPIKIHDLSVAEAAPPPNFIADLRRRHRSNVVQRFLFSLNHGCNSTIYNTMLALFIVFFYWLPAGIFSFCLGCLCFVVWAGVPAASGTIALVLGNSILRATHHAHYTNNASAAAIGAVGGILAYLCHTALYNLIFGIIFPIRRHTEEGEVDSEPIYITWPVATVVMTLAGVLGVSLLKHRHVDIGDIDLVHGARAGALGGALIGPVMFLGGAAIAVVLGILLSPLWAAMLLGFRWAYGRSSETWRGNTYRRSSCYTYGSCGDDSDIEEEVEHFEQREPNEVREFYTIHYPRD